MNIKPQFKYCVGCQLNKSIEKFHNNKRQSDGKQHRCKDCMCQYAKEYRLKNKDKIQKYRDNNFERIQTRDKKYHDQNRDKRILYSKQYYLANKDILRAKRRIYEANKMKNDPSYRLRVNVRRDINAALRTSLSLKNKNSSLKFLPYGMTDLKKHLESNFESWMTWENWGKYDPKTWDDNDSSTWTWQIDHIIPQTELPYASMEDENFKKCWALKNLRPLNAKSNLLEGILKVRHDEKCFIYLHSGTKFHMLNPKIESIHIEDIAHALSNLCRFNGNCSQFYSIAQHSVIVSENCDKENSLYGLLHDASEGLGLGDIVSPLKRTPEFEFYRKIEYTIQSLVYKKFGLEPIEPKDVKHADLCALATEARDLMKCSFEEWVHPSEAFSFKIEPLSPTKAKDLFLNRFYELTGSKYVEQQPI